MRALINKEDNNSKACGIQGIDTAVILAAGPNVRLRNILEDKPKGFLEIAGVCLIERSLRQLTSIGIEKLIIVTGYRAEQYEALAERWPGVCTIRNNSYAESGSMYSLYCTRGYVQDTFLLLESDLIYERRALEALLAFPGSNAILVSGFTHAGDEVYIETNGSLIHKMSKQRTELQNVIGELVGISKISPEMFQAMIEYAESYFRSTLRLDYEDCINGITEATEVFFSKIEDLIWTEIDDPFHLQRAKQHILPRILKKERHE